MYLQQLPFITQPPLSPWCWAAVSLSILQYMNIESKQFDGMSVCKLVTLVATSDSSGRLCCTTTPSAICEQQELIAPALWTLGQISGSGQQSLSFADITSQITKKLPIPVRINKNMHTTDFHYVTVAGFEDDETIWIHDPLSTGPQQLPFTQFSSWIVDAMFLYESLEGSP
jgi:hypothetical protein